jgi:hypothetical protein
MPIGDATANSNPLDCREFFVIGAAKATNIDTRTAGTSDRLPAMQIALGGYAGSYIVPADIGTSSNALFQTIYAELVAEGWPVKNLDTSLLWDPPE